MIKTIIFDIGNVLMQFRWREYFESFGFPAETLSRVCAATVQSAAWNEFDRGAVSDEELIERFIANDPSVEAEIRRVCENVHDMLAAYDYAIPWIRQLKADGYQVLVLSNFSAKAHRECGDMMGFLEEVDGGILSYQDKVIKPEPEIYRLLIERYHLKPEECVFLDDTLPNLAAAEAFGIHTIHFTDREAALCELKKLGVKTS